MPKGKSKRNKRKQKRAQQDNRAHIKALNPIPELGSEQVPPEKARVWFMQILATFKRVHEDLETAIASGRETLLVAEKQMNGLFAIESELSSFTKRIAAIKMVALPFITQLKEVKGPGRKELLAALTEYNSQLVQMRELETSLVDQYRTKYDELLSTSFKLDEAKQEIRRLKNNIKAFLLVSKESEISQDPYKVLDVDPNLIHSLLNTSHIMIPDDGSLEPHAELEELTYRIDDVLSTYALAKADGKEFSGISNGVLKGLQLFTCTIETTVHSLNTQRVKGRTVPLVSQVLFNRGLISETQQQLLEFTIAEFLVGNEDDRPELFEAVQTARHELIRLTELGIKLASIWWDDEVHGLTADMRGKDGELMGSIKSIKRVY